MIETPSVGIDDTLACSARVTNAGERSGVETVQLYVRDLVASVTRPVRELKGFARVRLRPGESRTVHFQVPVGWLGFIGVDNAYVVEPGEFRLWIAPDAMRGVSGTFRVRS